MNEQDREWLARLDERSINTYKLMEKLEKHQAEQNGYIRETLVSTQKNTVWRKVIVGTFAAIIGWFVKGEIG